MPLLKAIHKAVKSDMGDLKTMRALPIGNKQMDFIDPFIFLNHHGPQIYKPNNNGLPFGPHPHRGFETVTFILKGDLTHKDNSGASSVIRDGGIQWMTAGSGIIHSETSSPEFIKQGGELEILQLWVNLPGSLKMAKPDYKGLQKDQIPVISENNTDFHAVSGKWGSISGPVQPITDIHLGWLEGKSGGSFSFDVPEGDNVFFYVVRGNVSVAGNSIPEFHLAEFDKSGGQMNINLASDAVVLLGYTAPFGEPVVAYGPFVMNSMKEIQQAYSDYEQGKFGDWL